MRPLYEWCGLTVATVNEQASPRERAEAYRADITYATHKDIAKAIQSGAYKSARDHFDKGGFLEGRVGTLEGFDPEAYYDLNKDLHKAYSRSDSKALTEHYIKFGFAEGRKISKDQI